LAIEQFSCNEAFAWRIDVAARKLCPRVCP
jgi:hypothetical protein